MPLVREVCMFGHFFSLLTVSSFLAAVPLFSKSAEACSCVPQASGFFGRGAVVPSNSRGIVWYEASRRGAKRRTSRFRYLPIQENHSRYKRSDSSP
jgi:hypothetical protein